MNKIIFLLLLITLGFNSLSQSIEIDDLGRQSLESTLPDLLNNAFYKIDSDELRDLQATSRPISYTSDNISLEQNFRPYVVSTLITEIPNTLLLMFNNIRHLNIGLFRASAFIEGIAQRDNAESIKINEKNLLLDSGLLDPNSILGAYGHDLKGSDLINYWKVYDENIHHSKEIDSMSKKLLQIEQDLRNYLEPIVKTNPNISIIAAAADAKPIMTLAHEMYHALFFNNKKYRKLIYRFWKKYVSSEDKDYIRHHLLSFYNANDDYLIINEFQAYMLMPNADGYNQGNNILSKYYPRLKVFLENKMPDHYYIDLPNTPFEIMNPYCNHLFISK